MPLFALLAASLAVASGSSATVATGESAGEQAAGGGPPARVNFLVLFVDDWGYGDLGENCLHALEVPGARPGMIDRETSCDTSTGMTLTPAMDSLAKSGVRFTDFHVGAAVCTPSRAALQTGRMGARTGTTHNFGPGSLNGLPLNETTIAEYLRPRGYATCAVGKWHLGPQGAYAPTSRGYDAWLGIPESHDYGCTDTQMGAPDAGCLHWRHDRCPVKKGQAQPRADSSTTCHPGPVNPWNYSIPLMLGQGPGGGQVVLEQPADLDGTKRADGVPLSHRYARFVADFIANATAADKPFLVYLAFSHMHVPIVHSPAYAGRSGAAKGPLGDALMELDDSVQIVLDALDSHGVRNDTLVFLTGDNGPPEDQCDWGGSKGPFLGLWQKTGAAGAYGVGPGQHGGSAGKLTSWEAGHREVGVVSWPSRVRPDTVSHVLASSMDILPTVLKLAGVAPPADRLLDGKDLGPIIFADHPSQAPPSAHHSELFFSVTSTAYPESVSRWSKVGAQPANSELPTGLFEKVRLSDPALGQISAMYRVGYMAECCRSPQTGDANTPYNDTCSPGGALGFHPTWLKVPLLFNLTVDAAESTPLALGTPEHTAAWFAVNASQHRMLASLLADNRSHVVPNKKGPPLCCNRSNVVCRCKEEDDE